MYLTDPSVERFYAESHEENRLSYGLGPLEFERTKLLISRYLGSKCCIADVGGGPGHYARWLSGLGHQVTLIDPVRKHIHQANSRSKRSKRQFQAVLADARKLPLEDNSQDLVILHGPLYHLYSQSDRMAALKEARRVLKEDGLILGFAITHSASVIASLQSGMIHHQGIFDMCKRELLSGEHLPSPDFPGILPRSFFHRPSALEVEFEAAGLKPQKLLAVEGIAWLDNKFFESWADPVKKGRLLELVELTAKDRELLCFSPHIMLAAGH